MSIAHVKPRNEKVTCPYNPSHRIENGRMPIHLIKCRRNHDASQFDKCPFNASHVMPIAEKVYHISVCPDRAVAERYVVNCNVLKQTINSLNQDLSAEIELPQASENWDLEVGSHAGPGYDPTKRMSEQAFHNPNIFSSMTKSEKKEFRQAHNLNGCIANQQNGDEDDCDIVGAITAPLKHLRLPREDGMAAQSMLVLGGCGDSATPATISRLSSAKGSGNSKVGVETLVTISKGRGIYKFPDGSRPSALPAPGFGAENEALKYKLRLPSGSAEGKIFFPRPSELVNAFADNGSTTSEENDGLASNKLRNRLQKKIKQIDVLIEKQADGTNLNIEELEKISKKDEILQVLKLLPEN